MFTDIMRRLHKSLQWSFSEKMWKLFPVNVYPSNEMYRNGKKIHNENPDVKQKMWKFNSRESHLFILSTRQKPEWRSAIHEDFKTYNSFKNIHAHIFFHFYYNSSFVANYLDVCMYNNIYTDNLL